MAVTKAKLDDAHSNFEKHPNQQSAALFLSLLNEAHEYGAIDEDQLHAGLHDVERYLWKGGSVVS